MRAMGRDRQRLAELESIGCEVVRGELTDADFVARGCRDVGTVCHVAALSTPWGRWQDYYASNVQGTQNVVAGCRLHGVARCVFLSSPSVTSTRADMIDQDESQPFPARLISAYSLSKKMAEEVVKRAASQGLATVILRPKAVFGPGDTSLLPRLMRAAQAKRLKQIGSGENRVDLTYVDNVVHAIELAIDQPNAVGRTLIVTNDEHPLLWSVIRSACRALGFEAEIPTVSFRKAMAAATAMEIHARMFGAEPLLTRYSVTILAKTQTYDISASKQFLGYRPKVSLDDGIAATLADMRRGRR